MQANPENISGLRNRLASYLAADRKKVMVAGCLVLVMGFMWIRLLTGTGQPTSATAAVDYAMPQTASAAAESVVTYKEMPFAHGRNDRLARDFFSPGDWQLFLTKRASEEFAITGEQAKITDDDIRSRTIQQVASGLKLQIMEMGSKPQAFISDTLVKEGSVLTIAAGEAAFEFKVLSVSRKMVQLECEGKVFDITLREK